MNVWVVVVAIGVGSYLLRVSMLVLAARVGIPPVLEHAAAYAVPVSFATLCTIAIADHVTASNAAVAPLASVLAGAIAVCRTGSPHAAVLTGMPVYWIASAVFG